MGKKRKHTDAEVAAPAEKDESALQRPKRTLLGWKEKIEEKESDSKVFRNKEKVLVTCSRRINYRLNSKLFTCWKCHFLVHASDIMNFMIFRYRHLMLNVVSILPHCKKDNKVEYKESKGATLNELVELKGCSSCLFFEVTVFKFFFLFS